MRMSRDPAPSRTWVTTHVASGERRGSARVRPATTISGVTASGREVPEGRKGAAGVIARHDTERADRQRLNVGRRAQPARTQPAARTTTRGRAGLRKRSRNSLDSALALSIESAASMSG